jgi:ABC-2 type transport system ATP-binding protein
MMKSAVSPAIEVADLVVVRGTTRAVDALSFSTRPGEVTGLLGPSGCGKSTLMRSVVGVQKVTSGRVTVLGRPAGSASLRIRVGYVTQAASIYDDLTVAENLGFFRRVLGAPAEDVERVLAEVDLTSRRDQAVATLSGGQRSRASLAVALLGAPEVLVLDEPTVGLDPVLRRDLWGLFHRLADTGVALLVSSHVMDEADRCDRLLLMRDGRLLSDSTTPELLARTGRDDVEGAFLQIVEEAAA